jgi:hypothetical protein
VYYLEAAPSSRPRIPVSFVSIVSFRAGGGGRL